MTNVNLTPRLRAVSDSVPKNSILADIGSDHCYVPIYLVQQDIIKKAIAGEVAKGPLNNAIKEIEKAKLNNIIFPRLGNGLEVIKSEDKINTVVIAGMGGQLITDILSTGYDKLTGIKTLILQPNVGEYDVRLWLQNHNYKIIEEKIVSESYHVYEVITAVPGYVQYTDLELKFGPFLIKRKSVDFYNKWKHELKRLENIRLSITNRKNILSSKLLETNKQIKIIKQVLNNEN